MAKTNKEAIMKICKEIETKEGEGTVYSLGSKKANLNIKRWSTGIEDLDEILGGGMPEGRVVEIFGPESSGKTTLLYHLCGLHDMALDIPVEGTFDADRAKVFGNRPKQLLIYRPKYGEEAMNRAIKFAQAGIPLIGFDSVPSLVPKDDVEKVMQAANKNSIEEQRIGGTARLLNKYLPPLEEIIEFTGTTLIFINQVRDKMDAMMFGEKTQTPGGRKLKHACSLRIQVARKAWIEIPNKNPKSTANNEKVGMIMKCKVVKSKVCNPMGECEIPLFFDRGFVSFDDVQSIRKELMKQRAEQFGKRSTCLKRHYGCVIVKDDVIVATGYNGSPRGCDNCCDIGKCNREDSERYQGYEHCPAVHAEQNALLSVDRSHSKDSTLYLACECDGKEDEGPQPCSLCAKMIKNAGIMRVVTRKGDSFWD